MRNNKSGLDISFALFNLFLNGKIKKDVLSNKFFLIGATVHQRYLGVKIITEGLVFYSTVFTIITGLLAVFAAKMEYGILSNSIFLVISCTSVPIMSTSVYLIIKTAVPQINYFLAIKKGLGEKIIKTKGPNLYNRDYIIGLIVLGIPSAIVFVTLILNVT